MSDELKEPKLKIPRGHIIWENRYNAKKELIEIVTSDALKKRWIWFKVGKDGALSKIMEGKSPQNFHH